jgi:hypothetical protein
MILVHNLMDMGSVLFMDSREIIWFYDFSLDVCTVWCRTLLLRPQTDFCEAILEHFV